MSKKVIRNLFLLAVLGLLGALLMFFLHRPKPIAANRFIEPDQLFQLLETNVREDSNVEKIVDIDHARLGAKAGSPMPPSHVLIWSSPELDARILEHNSLAAVDLPLRILAYENSETGKGAVIYNSYEFVAQRHSLPEDAPLRAGYESAIERVTKGIPESALTTFPSDPIPSGGLVTLKSPYDFATTQKRIMDAINSQSDTVNFGSIDFAARSQNYGVTLRPLTLVLFGGPGPGGKAMASAPTLGLDAFCQKLVIWQDEAGTVNVTFNDLLALAKRQNVSGGLPLRVINRRLKEAFSAALKP